MADSNKPIEPNDDTASSQDERVASLSDVDLNGDTNDVSLDTARRTIEDEIEAVRTPEATVESVSETVHDADVAEPIAVAGQGSVVEAAAGAPSGTGAGEPTVVPAEESTIGTGTSMALGCVAGTVLLIAFGLIFLAISAFLR